jgi:hypothetical protein
MKVYLAEYGIDYRGNFFCGTYESLEDAMLSFSVPKSKWRKTVWKNIVRYYYDTSDMFSQSPAYSNKINADDYSIREVEIIPKGKLDRAKDFMDYRLERAVRDGIKPICNYGEHPDWLTDRYYLYELPEPESEVEEEPEDDGYMYWSGGFC